MFRQPGPCRHPLTKTDLWFSPSAAKRIYGLSEDTRSKGLRELRRAGLVTARKKAASEDVLDFRRLRNTYRLQLEQLEKVASVPGLEALTPEPISPTQIAVSDGRTPPPSQWLSFRPSPTIATEELLATWGKKFEEARAEQQQKS